jgi:phosphatidylinositol glycan class A protein
MAHECILHARTMGVKAVYTDHSLFGFADLGSSVHTCVAADTYGTPRACEAGLMIITSGAIHLNALMQFTLSEIDQVVCVSHCSKENLVLRAQLDPFKVRWSHYSYVIQTATLSFS